MGIAQGPQLDRGSKPPWTERRERVLERGRTRHSGRGAHPAAHPDQLPERLGAPVGHAAIRPRRRSTWRKLLEPRFVLRRRSSSSTKRSHCSAPRTNCVRSARTRSASTTAASTTKSVSVLSTVSAATPAMRSPRACLPRVASGPRTPRTLCRRPWCGPARSALRGCAAPCRLRHHRHRRRSRGSRSPRVRTCSLGC